VIRAQRNRNGATNVTSTRNILLALAALSGLTAVGAGAFAAHGIADPEAKDWLKTGASYQMWHALAVFASMTTLRRPSRSAILTPVLFLAGSAVFSGSLYAMALGAPRWFGAVTPLGGLCLMAAWGVLAAGAFRSNDNGL
jgi:uncharacterized membrane protein YgdD (TMEM256/DUF423 family)